MEGGTGVYYQALPAVGPDGKNVMKLIPIQKVNGQFYKSTFQDRNSTDIQSTIVSKPVHPPATSFSQAHPHLSSVQHTTVFKTVPQANIVHKSAIPSQVAVSTIKIQTQPAVQVSHLVNQTSVKITSLKSMLLTHAQPVTVKSPVLPNDHFLQIPPNAKVRTIPATALPQSIKCRILNSVNNNTNVKLAPPTVVLVSPVDSVKLNRSPNLVSLLKPGQIDNSQGLKPPQKPVSISKPDEDANAPLKWVVQEGKGGSALCLVPNSKEASNGSPPQTEHEKVTPGKDNALVMYNGKVYFVAKKNSEIVKNVLVREEEKKDVLLREEGKTVSSAPVVSANSTLPKIALHVEQKSLAGEIIDLCEDDEVLPIPLHAGSGNLTTQSMTVLDDSEEESNVIFVSYIPPKTTRKSASKNRSKEAIDPNSKFADPTRLEKTLQKEREEGGGLGDERLDQHANGNKESESGHESARNEMGKNIGKDIVLVTKSVTVEENSQDPSVEVFGVTKESLLSQEISTPKKSRPKSDSQLRKEFGVIKNVQVCLQRINPDKAVSQQAERPLVNKRTLAGLRKAIKNSKLELKINQLLQVPCTKTEVEAKRKKQNKGPLVLIPTITSPASETLDIPPVESSQEEVSLKTGYVDHLVNFLSETSPKSTNDISFHIQSPTPKSSEMALPLRKLPPRFKKAKVCTACPCGTFFGAKTTSSLQKHSLCADVTPQKGTRKSCLNKSPEENRQTQKHPLKEPALTSVTRQPPKSSKKDISSESTKEMSLISSVSSFLDDIPNAFSNTCLKNTTLRTEKNFCKTEPSISSRDPEKELNNPSITAAGKALNIPSYTDSAMAFNNQNCTDTEMELNNANNADATSSNTLTCTDVEMGSNKNNYTNAALASKNPTNTDAAIASNNPLNTVADVESNNANYIDATRTLNELNSTNADMGSKNANYTEVETASNSHKYTGPQTASNEAISTDPQTASDEAFYTNPQTASDEAFYTNPQTASDEAFYTDPQTASNEAFYTGPQTASDEAFYTGPQTASDEAFYKDLETASDEAIYTGPQTASYEDNYTDAEMAADEDTYTDAEMAADEDTYTDAEMAANEYNDIDAEMVSNNPNNTDEETASSQPSKLSSESQVGTPIVTIGDSESFSLDAEEIKRREKIKRLKDLLKEKEAALERMQMRMDI